MLNIEKKSVSDQVLAYLRKQIMLNELKEGYHLKESYIASKLNVSRGPVREALTQLVSENLVEKRSNGRTVVSKFNMRDIINLYNCRILLEKEALAEIDIETLKQNTHHFYSFVKQMEEGNDKGENDIEADLSFHKLLIELSRNKTLLQLWISLQGMILTLINITSEYLQLRQQETIGEHLAIVRFLEDGNLKGAQKSLEIHLKNAVDHYYNAVKDLKLNIGGER